MKGTLICGAAAVVCAGGLARADIEIVQYDGDDIQVSALVDIPPGEPITIHISSSSVRSVIVRSYASDPNEDDIGRITITDDSWGNDIRLYVAQSKDLTDQSMYASPDDRACHHWAGIEDHRDSGTLALKVYIGGDLTSSIQGRIEQRPYTRLNTLQVEGTIGAKVYTTDGLYRVECGQATRSTGTAFWSEGNIGLIRAISIDLDCDIIAGKGKGTNDPTYTIDAIDAPEGNIGTETPTPIKIGTDGSANVRITQITAKRGIRADIVAPQGIAFIRTTGVMIGEYFSEGDVSGSITTNTLLSQSPTEGGLFDVAGNMLAAITLTQGLPENASVRIGGDLGTAGTSPATPVVTIGGNAQLKGNIIFDVEPDDPDEPTNSHWKNQVIVQRPSGSGGDVVLGPGESPAQGYEYGALIADLGGGSVSGTPFELHAADCDPPAPQWPDFMDILQSELNFAVNPVTNTMIPQVPMYLRFRGPVKADGQGDPFIIFHFVENPGGIFDNPWVAKNVTDKFTITVNPAGPGSARTVRIEGKEGLFYFPGFYSIQSKRNVNDPTPGDLLCDVPGDPPVANFTYSFWVRWDCNYNGVRDQTDIAADGSLDQNSDGLIDDCDREGWCVADFWQDGFVNGDDANVFEATWALTLPWADINGDGFVTGDDYDAFANAYAAGCNP